MQRRLQALLSFTDIHTLATVLKIASFLSLALVRLPPAPFDAGALQPRREGRAQSSALQPWTVPPPAAEDSLPQSQQLAGQGALIRDRQREH